MSNTFLHTLAMIVLSTLGSGCGEPVNYLEPFSPLNDEQQARQALDNEEWDEAIELYSAILESDPERHDLRPLQATALAARGGIRVLELVLSQFSNTQAPTGGFLSTMDRVVPESANEQMRQDVSSGVDALLAIPETYKDDDYGFQQGIMVQKTVYTTVYTAMLMDSILVIGADGEVDPSALENMTEEQALEIIEAMLQVASVSDPGNPMATAVAQAYVDINAQEGTTTSEKLASYIDRQ